MLHHKVSFVSTRHGIALRAIEGLLALLLFTAAVSVRDLPLVDLPQHALQLANWLRLDAGAPGVADLELNFRTPYLLAYPVARALAFVISVQLALKLVFVASVVAQAVALRKSCQWLGHDPWLGLLGYPLGLGYSFCFGFVSFCAALPLVYLAVGLCAQQREAPTAKRGAWLALTLTGLLVAHGVALAFTLLVLGPLLLCGGGKWWQRLWPALAPVLVGIVWLVPGSTSTRLGGDVWQLEPQRWLELPAQLVGIGAADWTATLGGIALLGVLLLSLGQRRSLPYFVPLAITLLGYGLFPSMFRGSGPLHPRFSSLLVPALLLAFSPLAQESVRRCSVRRTLIALVASSISVLFCSRLDAYNRETSAFHELVRDLPAGLRLRPLVFERSGNAFPGIPAHLHLPAYYSVEKGGHPGYTFAMYSISVVRSKRGAKVMMWGGAEWAPETFDERTEANDYDYFAVRSTVDRSAQLFGSQPALAVLDRHVGNWWGYRRFDAPRRQLPRQ